MRTLEQAALKKGVKPFEKTDTARSVLQLINTLLPLAALWAAAAAALSVSYALSLALSIIAAGFLVRTFIIFHDCCHGSFFKSKKANDLVGTLTGILTLVPYRQWKRTHSIHHATSGNLEKRGTGDIWVMTVREYREAAPLKRLAYRLYRNPLIMFGLGPTYTFLIEYRFNRRGAAKGERFNTYLTNAGIAALFALLIALAGWKTFLLVQGPLFLAAGLAGVWLFYVQHNFEDSYFAHDGEWNYVRAAVEGSSYYRLPKVLQWLTGNIGFHHVHHLSPKVPNYFLERAHEAVSALSKAPAIGLAESLKSLKFRLWDEERGKFVSFREAKKTAALKERSAQQGGRPPCSSGAASFPNIRG